MNEEVASAQTGTAALPDYQSLDPNHLKLDRLMGGIFAAVVSLIAVIGLVIGAMVNDSLGFGFAIAIVLAVFAIVFLVWAGLIYPALAYRHASWRLSPHGLEIRRGVWWRHRIVVPRSRIQHSDIEQGPLQRGFGIATLIVHTAGTRNSWVRLEGLAAKTAESLRDTLVSELSSQRREPMKSPTGPAESHVASALPAASIAASSAQQAVDSQPMPADESGNED